MVARLLAGGEGLVRYPGGTALVAGVLPGETVLFQVAGRHRGALRGRLLAVERPSPHRITPACPLAAPSQPEVCGGCALQMVEPGEHANLKWGWIADHFSSSLHGAVASGWLPGAPPAGGWHRRRRVRWHVAGQGGEIIIGFRPKRSALVLESGGCCVVTPRLAALRALLQQAMRAGKVPVASAVMATELGDGIHLVLEQPSSLAAGDPPFDAVDGLFVQWWWRNDGALRPWNRPVRPLHDLLPAADGGDVALQVGATDFVQADAAANRALVAWLQQQAPACGRVVDLFCGVGNCSLPLASPRRRVVGADSNRAAIACANRSAARLGVDADYRAVDLFQPFDPAPFVGADLLLLDPPRKGANRVVTMMARLLPRRVVMIHCDPASGGRDGAAMVRQGYRLEALYALDLFAWSGHVEAISLWTQ